MEKFIRNILSVATLLFLLLLVWSAVGSRQLAISRRQLVPPDTLPKDSNSNLRYPIPKDPGKGGGDNPLYLGNPKNMKDEVEYDPATNEYIIKHKIGDVDYKSPDYIPFSEYMEYDIDQSLKNYWKERAEAQTMSAEKGILPKIKIGGEVFDRIFGSNTIDIRPQGSAELIFGVTSNRRDDPSLNVKQRRITNFDFQEKIQMNVTAKIGDKINLGVNYNTEASFDFENKMKLAYEGKEDEIIKLIEAGDVSLPLNSTLIKGSQSLFGFKTKMQFGKIFVTGIFSEQKSKSETISVTGGAQVSEFTLKADQYEEYKHYFLSHYFRDHYEQGLKQLPIIGSSINITKMEVWITNIGSAIGENRNIIAFSDLGEENLNRFNNKKDVYTKPNPYTNKPFTSPDNRANTMYDFSEIPQIRDINEVSTYLKGKGYLGGVDYEKVGNAKKLSPSEYNFNSKLGYISLNTQLNSDQVLAIAFQYKKIGDTTTYEVGELTTGGPVGQDILIVKLLKGTTVNTRQPIWNLMMKNIYSIGAYQVNPDNFRLNIFYTDNNVGVPTGFLNETRIKGHPLIRVMGLDRLNTQLDAMPDGVFDFIDVGNSSSNTGYNNNNNNYNNQYNQQGYNNQQSGFDNQSMGSGGGGTIDAARGRIYFPMLEPFGKTMRDSINPDGMNKAMADKYAYDSLYTNTKVDAQKFPDKNKFTIEGTYKSAGGSDISLNAMNVPQGSVKVTVGGVPLTENVDFTVDYTMGRVKIINEGIMSSGAPIQISLENNSLFSIQKKTLMGTRIDYEVAKDINIGATILHLTERPLTQKINFGDEPISNTMWGMDVNYQTESRFITKMLDKLPFYNTKTPSKVTLSGEFANLIPGHSRAIGKTGISYIDDFEGSTSGIDLKTQGSWKISSTPQGQDIFPEAGVTFNKNLRYGFNRAKLAWYAIDPLFLRNNNLTPTHIRNDKNQQSNHFVREILETEVFPNKQTPNGQPVSLPVLNLSFYPDERGPYNYDVKASPGVSYGINADGKLINPKTRWGGIMRNMTTTDFESTNIEYIQFWMMDPFVYSNGQNGQPVHSGGELYFNIGDISEDVLMDSRKSFENGLPIDANIKNVDTTAWGIVPELDALVNTFDNNPESRKFQDVGLDGLGLDYERTFFKTTYLDKIANDPDLGPASKAYTNANTDPSADDYKYFRGDELDLNNISILERYKNYNGMDGNSATQEQTDETYPTAANTLPDIEDINRDNTLSDDERYFQYRINLSPDKMNIGENFIADHFDAGVSLKNGNRATIRWYQFKIPIRSYNKIIGNIQDFKSIRFMRIFFRGFEEAVHCRFATLELIRSEWRKYNYDLLSPGEYQNTDEINNTSFTLSSVNIEENGKRTPIPYVLPPNIDREINYGSTNLQQLNEQSLEMSVCNLIDGDAKAVYKTSELDVRKYKRLKMFVHAEAQKENDILKSGDLTVFVRLGTDFTDNYYEYEIPVTPTRWGTSNDYEIWPESNNFNVEFSILTNTKQERNIKMREPNSNISMSTPYIKYDGQNKITVVGVPNLSDVKTIMIGVRNPKKRMMKDDDDGLSKCAEIWFDELRLTDFDEKGGWAAVARANTNLADLGNITLAGNVSTPSFGNLEQKINDRQKASIMQYDIATNLELGKFLPEKAGIRIPMHFDFSEAFANPEYNPLNPDIKFKDDLATYEKKSDRDSIKKIAQDYTMRKNLNFTNVKKVKTGATAKPHIYDIENLDVSYSYSELFHRDVDIEYNSEKKYRAGLGYNFVGNPKKISPFAKVKMLSGSKYLSLIKDFNFYFVPKMLTFQTEFDRQYTENLLRQKTAAKIIIEPTYVKLFNWSRIYGLKYDLSQSLKLDFQAQALARIDEPPGSVSSYTSSDKKQIKDNIFDKYGRMTDYNQKLTINYNIPINKLPILDWISSTATYSGEYQWKAQPLSIQDKVGNDIQNGNTKQLNVNANLTNLYNKISYLKEINQSDKEKDSQKYKPGERFKNEGIPKDAKSKQDIKKRKSSKGKDGKDSTDAEPVNVMKLVLDNTLRILMGIKTVSLAYTETNGTLLPGFEPVPKYLGQDWKKMAPGTGFIFGSQQDIRNNLFRNGWVSDDTLMTSGYMTKSSQNLSFRSTIEPFPDFRIEVSATRNISSMAQSYLRYDSIYVRTKKPGINGNYYNEYSKLEAGNFSMSFFTWNTAFTKDNKDYSSKTFQKFRSYLLEVAQTLAEKNSNWINAKRPYLRDSASGIMYPDGYGPTSQDVMLPAFLAAYTGNSPTKFINNIFPKIPKPNWRITFTGLTKIDFLQQYFESITIGHAYQSTYNIGNYTTNARYVDGDDIRNDLRNYIPKYDIGQVTITEQFSPFINIDLVWVNSLMSKFEVRKTRNLSLSFANNQLTEIKSSEVAIGLGYRIKNVTFYVKGMGGSKKKKLESDINVKADVSIRTNKTVLRKMVEDYNQISTGQRVISINTSADYQLSDRFEIRLFFDKIINNPFVSSQFPNSNTNAGISLRFTLAQ